VKMPRIVAEPRNRPKIYGVTPEEKKEFLLKFSKLAGTMSVADLAKEMGLTEKQTRSFANRSGWSIKYVPNK